MNNIRKFSIALAISLILPACGGGSSSEAAKPVPQPEQQPQPEPQPEPEPEPEQPINKAPTVSVENITADENTAVTITAKASDSDDDELAYSWTQISGEAVKFTDNVTSISFITPEVSTDTEVAFELEVSDSQLFSKATSIVTIKNLPVKTDEAYSQLLSVFDEVTELIGDNADDKYKNTN